MSSDPRQGRHRGLEARRRLTSTVGRRRMGSTSARYGEIVAKGAGGFTLLLIAVGDRSDIASWALPAVVVLALASIGVLLLRPPGGRRLSGLLDLLFLLLLTASTTSTAVTMSVYGGVAFWAFSQRPAWAGALTAALALGNTAITVVQSGAPTLILAVGINGLWITIATATVASAWREHLLRTQELEDAKQRLLEDAFVADSQLLMAAGAELHDGPLQLLMTVAQDLAEDDLDPADARGLVLRASREMRDILGRVEPNDTPEHVRQELADWCRVLGARRHFRWTVDVDDRIGRIDPVAAAGARELITNAAKHAGATHIETRIELVGEHLLVTVRDDGVGMPGDARPGFGLRALRRRVHTSGGSLVFLPREVGTAATLSVPHGLAVHSDEDPLLRAALDEHDAAAERSAKDRGEPDRGR